MTDYDELFADTAPDDSVFAERGALDPLASPDDIRGRETQKRELATLLNGVTEGYLPPTVAIHGPPGTGKTVTTRQVVQAFVARRDDVAYEYVNLKECRSIFSTANEIQLELTESKCGAYESLDGVFEGIWTTLADYPTWTVLILDKIDHIAHDSNYDPSEFLYRLLRGGGKLAREIQLSAWLISNELLEVDLRLDSRVESAMSDEAVFFPPYGREELGAILRPRLNRAFRDGALPEAMTSYGIAKATERWGDARKALRLFRNAGETANERGLDAVTQDCLDANLTTTDKDATIERLLSLPMQHFFVLLAMTQWLKDGSGDIIQSVTSTQVRKAYETTLKEEDRVGERAMREIVTDLETMGLVETWIESRGNEGRIKQLEVTFDPTWVLVAHVQYVATIPGLKLRHE